jgi:hypothetical protein
MNPVLQTATARLVDYAITMAFTKLGRDAVVSSIDTWRLEGNSEEQVLSRLKALVESSENAAADAVSKMPD